MVVRKEFEKMAPETKARAMDEASIIAGEYLFEPPSCWPECLRTTGWKDGFPDS